MSVEYYLAFLIPFILTSVLAWPVLRLARRFGVLDVPNQPRKIQAGPVPMLGGVAVYGSLLLTVLGWQIFSAGSFGEFISQRYLLGILLGGGVLIFGGFLDDKFSLSPAKQFVFPALAALIVILLGVQLSYINNPFGEAFLLDTVKISGYPIFGGLFILLWVLGMIYTTKFLDGLDGLVSGITGIAAVVLFFLSLLPQVGQPDTALLSIMFGGSALGFLAWNFHPAKIFLGEGGSTFCGFMIGVLAVISGGKIATALLVMGIPILDAAWVIARRLFSHYSPFAADRKHLHFRLLDIGLSHRQSVLVLYFLSAAFGVSGLYLQSVGKVVALVILFAVMLVLAILLVIAYRRKYGRFN